MGAQADFSHIQKSVSSGRHPNQSLLKNLRYPLLSDPSRASCRRYVGECDLGAFLAQVGVSDALKDGAVTANRGCVVLDEAGKVVYAFSGEGHPGKMPPLAEIRAALGV